MNASEPAEPPLPNQRRHGRIRCEGLTCELGTVIDLSASGLQIEGRGPSPVRVGQTVWLVLRGGEQGLRLRVLIRRVRRQGFLRYRVGGELVGMTPERAVGLLSLLRMSRLHAVPGQARASPP